MYSSGNSADQARQDEDLRQKKIDIGMSQIGQTFAHFNNGFYNDRANAYLQYATPDLTAQSAQTRKSLTYALARAGLLDSGASVDRNAALDREVSKNQRIVADQALANANQLRSQVEDQRGQLVSQLEASADPQAAANMAIARAGELRAPTPMQPLGDMFADFTNIYGVNRQAQAYNPSVPSVFSPSNWSFGGGGGSGGGSSERIIP